MKRKLLDLLADPETGAGLRLTATAKRDGEVWEGRLTSEATGRDFPIEADIPRFVPRSNYAGSFGLQWNRFAQVQLDSATGAGYSETRFTTETRWAPAELRGKWVLDGGCGCGRFSEVAARAGAEVVALDYSSAVEAAARNLAGFPNVHVVQGDLLRPPFRPGSLPRVFSIGVLQHTPDPAATLRSVLGLVEPGGSFAFSIYARRWYTRLNAKYVVRPLTRRLPPHVLLRLIERSMPVLFPVTTALFCVPGLGKVARFTIPVANYAHKDGFTRAQRYAEAVLDTFDMLAPTFDNPMTAGEVEEVFRAAGVADYHFLRRVPIVVTGTLPPAEAGPATARALQEVPG